MRWCKFTLANTGLLNRVNGFSTEYCIFKDSNCGFKAESVDSAFCSNLLCEEIIGGSYGGIFFSGVVDGCIEKNVVNNCENGIKIKNENIVQVENNFITNCSHGFDISWYAFPLIEYNDVTNCEIAFYLCERFDPKIRLNNVVSNYGFRFHRWFYNPVYNLEYNNLNCSNYAFYMEWKTTDVYAENNYFYTLDENEIRELIFDRNDIQEQQEDYGEVMFQPFLTEEYNNAGVQTR